MPRTQQQTTSGSFYRRLEELRSKIDSVPEQQRDTLRLGQRGGAGLQRGSKAQTSAVGRCGLGRGGTMGHGAGLLCVSPLAGCFRPTGAWLRARSVSHMSHGLRVQRRTTAAATDR